jgi:hypothetical protein
MAVCIFEHFAYPCGENGRSLTQARRQQLEQDRYMENTRAKEGVVREFYF